MAKKTLLEMVQNILSDMSSDEVNSISDAVESLQVADIIRETYFAIVDETFWPREAKRISLTAISNTSTPTHFKIPENVQKLAFIKYDVQSSTDTFKRYRDIKYREPKYFLDLSLGLKSSDSNVDTVTNATLLDGDGVALGAAGSQGTTLLIVNDKAPTYWTSFDDEYVIMDSYDSTVDDTLKESKLIAYAEVEPSWTHSDSFIPTDIPAKAFPFLLAEAKSNCFVTLKQEPNPKIEQVATRLRNKAKHDKIIAQKHDNYPNYGRV